MGVSSWLDSLPSRESAKTYSRGVRLLVLDGDLLVHFARFDRRMAEDFMIRRIVEWRVRVRAPTLRTYASAVKSLLEFEEVEVSWRRVKKALPRARFVASDRAPTLEEIRRVLNWCRGRSCVMVLVMVSSGIRIGAFQHLRVGDYRVLESGVGLIKVYRGFPEEYFSFLTPEAVKAVEEYFEGRRLIGEKVGADSPFLRDMWDSRNGAGFPERASWVKTDTLENQMHDLWVLAGVKRRNEGLGEFKSCHGFRKWFKTRASQTMKRNDVELLVGHLSGIDASYYKPTLEELEREYLKAVPHLTISEVVEVRRDMGGKLQIERKKRDEYERDFLKLKSDVEEIRRRIG